MWACAVSLDVQIQRLIGLSCDLQLVIFMYIYVDKCQYKMCQDLRDLKESQDTELQGNANI